MRLLDFYRSRFGNAVRQQGNGWNGPCPLCGGEPGKSDRFMVWPERDSNLGKVCAEHGIAGVWSCRQCGEHGDTIAYLMKADGYSFREALGQLGISGFKPGYRRKKAPLEPIAQTADWTPKELSDPCQKWKEYALKLVEEGERNIWNNTQALKWLESRGVCEDAIRKYRIGYLAEENEKYHGRFRPRSVLGLDDKTGSDGKIIKRIMIPRGITIPSFNENGEVINLRFRRHREEIKQGFPKYTELEGSYHGPLFLRSSQALNLSTYFITEAELDAILIHHASGGIAGAIAVRTNRGKPDMCCHNALKAAARICIALDYDSAGAEGCDFWEQEYENSMRWPTPTGKDPGDAFALGVNIREWIEAALPECCSMPDVNIREAGHKDNFQTGKKKIEGKGDDESVVENGGKREARNRIYARATADDWAMEQYRWEETQPEPFPRARESDFTAYELNLLKSALRSGYKLDDVYLDVAVIWLLWRKFRITFRWRKNENGQITGFKWDHDYTEVHKNKDGFYLLWQCFHTSRAFRKWLCNHPADNIDAKNILNIGKIED